MSAKGGEQLKGFVPLRRSIHDSGRPGGGERVAEEAGKVGRGAGLCMMLSALL